jgi:hypothetical protein
MSRWQSGHVSPFTFSSEVRGAARNSAYVYPELRYPAHRYQAVPSAGFEATTPTSPLGHLPYLLSPPHRLPILMMSSNSGSGSEALWLPDMD